MTLAYLWLIDLGQTQNDLIISVLFLLNWLLQTLQELFISWFNMHQMIVVVIYGNVVFVFSVAYVAICRK